MEICSALQNLSQERETLIFLISYTMNFQLCKKFLFLTKVKNRMDAGIGCMETKVFLLDQNRN